MDSDGRKLHRLLYRLTLRQGVAEELLQELVVRLLGSDGFEVAENRAAFAFRTAIHLAIDWRRQCKRPQAQTMACEPAAPQEGVAEQVGRAEDLARLLRALEKVAPAAREAFVMHFLDERSYEQIAQMLGGTAHSARARCHKAVRQVRELLAARDDSGRTENVPAANAADREVHDA